MAKKPVLLCIMDGFGWVPNETFGNAVVAAKTPHLDALMAKYPMTTIDASGMAVGLPDGQMGNSEVGHTNMGAGRIVYQQLTLITKSIRDGAMLKNPVLVKNMKAAIDAGKAIHLKDATSDGRFQYPESAKAEGLVSVLSAPLSVGGKVIGLIRVYSSEEREFTDDEDSFMMAVAAISAVAIENARLHDALRNNYELMAKHAYSVYED